MKAKTPDPDHSLPAPEIAKAILAGSGRFRSGECHLGMHSEECHSPFCGCWCHLRRLAGLNLGEERQ